MATSWVGYARLSLDRNGEGLAIDRQTEDMQIKATALGWGDMTEVYADNDLTADPRKAVRPAFQRLLDDMRSGRVKHVLCYDQDRLVRDMRELEDIVDAVQAGGVQFTSCNGDIDLLTDNGQMVARIKAAVARNELDKIARRTARQKRQRVEQGKPLGQRFRTFGYERDWTVRQDEADVVREVFTRAIGGESQRGITRALVARGVTTTTGGEWTSLQTRRLLREPKYAGLQTYKGQVIGKSTVVPALISEGEFQAVQRPVHGAVSNVRKYILSGILVCNECKAPMTGTRVVVKDKVNVRYRCESRSGGCGKVSIKAEWIEDLVDRYMTQMIGSRVARENQTRQPVVVDNSERIKDVEERITKLQAMIGTGDIEAEDGIAILREARRERGRLVKEDAERVTEALTWEAALEDYDAGTMEERLLEIRKVFKFIFISPGTRSRKFDPSRVMALGTDGVRRIGGAIDTYDLRTYRGEPQETSESP